MGIEKRLGTIASASIVLIAGCTIAIPESTRELMAVQNAEARLAVGLASHVKSSNAIRPDKKQEVAGLYNDSVVANNAVIENLRGQLSQPGVRLLVATSADKLSMAATAQLRKFRTVAQQTASLPELDPSAKKARGTELPEGVSMAFAAAHAAYEWWLSDNARQREALKAHLETYELKQWVELP